MKLTLSSILFAFVISGCASQESSVPQVNDIPEPAVKENGEPAFRDTVSVSKPMPPTAEGLQLSESEVLKMSDAMAKQKIEEIEPFDLQFYPERRAKYEPRNGLWSVFYERKPKRHGGDYFTITVNDATKKAEYYRGPDKEDLERIKLVNPDVELE